MRHLILLAGLGLATPALAQDAQSYGVLGTIEANGQFTTLLAAIEAAGMAETLEGRGPFTVFAPTDAAFEALPEGELDALLADPAALAEVVGLHVAPGEIVQIDFPGTPSTTTLAGPQVSLTVEGGPHVNDAAVLIPDIQADNGVIHAIDKVLLP